MNDIDDIKYRLVDAWSRATDTIDESLFADTHGAICDLAKALKAVKAEKEKYLALYKQAKSEGRSDHQQLTKIYSLLGDEDFAPNMVKALQSDIDTIADHNIELQYKLAAVNDQLEAMRKGEPVAWLRENSHHEMLFASDLPPGYTPPNGEGWASLFLAAPKVPHVDALAQHIRKIDGSNTLGAGALAEAIVEYINATPESKEGERNEDPEIVIRLTAAIREADMKFDHVGGATRHYVRDCLLPALAKQGLRITDVQRVDICDG